MLVLNSVNDRIQAVLDDPVATENIQYLVSYVDMYDGEAHGYGDQQTNSDDTTIVTILDSPSVFGGLAPRAGTFRQSMTMHIHNADTADATITVYYNRNGTLYIIFRITVPSKYTVTMPSNGNPIVVDETGAQLVGGGTGAGGDPDAVIVWHFDTDLIDTCGQYTFASPLGSTVLETLSPKKFGDGSMQFSIVSPADPGATTPPMKEWGHILGGDWTVEGWYHTTDNGAGAKPTGEIRFGGVLISTLPALLLVVDNQNNVITMQIRTQDSTTIGVASSATTLADNTWIHWAFVKEGTTYSVYFDGTRRATATNLTPPLHSHKFWLTGATSLEDVHWDEIRISRIARYSGTTLTPPAAAFTNPNCDEFDYTLFFPFDYDLLSSHGIYTFTGTRDTSIFNCGVGSVRNAATTIVTSPNQPMTEINDHLSGDWTLECWLRLDDDTAIGDQISISGLSSGGAVACYLFAINANTNTVFGNVRNAAGSLIASWTESLTVNVDTWYHCAIVFDSVASEYRVFFDGFLIETDISSDVMCPLNTLQFAASGTNGWYDEWRFTPLAKYNSTFSPACEI